MLPGKLQGVEIIIRVPCPSPDCMESFKVLSSITKDLLKDAEALGHYIKGSIIVAENKLSECPLCKLKRENNV